MPGMPTQGDSFPSPEWAAAFEQYAINDAWISEDQEKLQQIYQGVNGTGTRNRGDNPTTHYNRSDGTRRTGGLRGILSRMFNGKVVDSSQARTRIHAPVASNLATLSADLLTAEPPVFRFVDADGEVVKGKAQERLDAIANSPDHHRATSHAAELTAGLGATILTAQWDPSVSDRPWMDVSPCDAAIPEFRGGRLIAANLYTMHVVTTGTNLTIVDKVYIHIERHEIGKIVHGLYEVKLFDSSPWGFETLQNLVPLDKVEATAHIPSIPGSAAGVLPNTVELRTGIDRLTASWWRNLPTKTFRKSLPMLGRADFEGIEQLLDAVDEVWSSWMRDIKIARARLIVPESFLDVQGPGLGGQFDDDAEILTPLAYVDLGPEKNPITAQQFEIRYQEHAGTLLGLTREITQFAGYSLASYGEDSSRGGGITATEVTDRTTRTERTRDKKFRYFAEAMQPLALALLDLDRVHYRGGATIPENATLSIEIPELSQLDPEKEARMIQYLRAAMAASTSTLVKMQHPDWDSVQIDAEVTLIRQENGLGEEADPGTEGRVDENGDPIPPDEDPKGTGAGSDTDLDKEKAA